MPNAEASVIELSDRALQKLLGNPETRDAVEKSIVSGERGGTVKIEPPDSATAAKLQDALGKSEVKPTGDVAPAPEAAATPTNPLATPPPNLKSTFDRDFAPPIEREPIPATSSVNSATPGELDTLKRRLKVGAAGAGAAGTAYGAYKLSGDQPPPDDTQLGATPTQDTPASRTGTGLRLGGESIPAAAAAPTSADTERRPTHISASKITPTTIKDSGTFGTAVSNLQTQADTFARDHPDWSDEDQKKWDDKLATIEKAYYANKRTNDWGQVAERIAHAIAQMGAAMHGLKTGVDLSGLKFDKTDWDAKNRQLFDELKFDAEGVNRGRTQDFQTHKSNTERKQNLYDQVSKMMLQKAQADDRRAEENARLRGQTDTENARLGFEAEKSNQAADTDYARQQTQKEIEDAREQKARRERTNHDVVGMRKSQFVDADKRWTALNKAAGILAGVKDNSKAFAAAKDDIGKAMGEAGLGLDWADIQQKGIKRNGWFDGKSDEDGIIEELRARAQDAMSAREKAQAAYEAAARGETGGSTGSNAPQAPAGKVAVISTKDGKTYYLDPDKAKLAVANGDAKLQ